MVQTKLVSSWSDIRVVCSRNIHHRPRLAQCGRRVNASLAGLSVNVWIATSCLRYASRRFCSPSCCHETCRRPASGRDPRRGKCLAACAKQKVWEFFKANPDLRSDGHNVFLYHHPERRDMPMDADFGVEVLREFEPEGEVRTVETPAGEAAIAVHVGSLSPPEGGT